MTALWDRSLIHIYVSDRVTLWGIDNATSWRAKNCPLIFDKDYQPKEAYYALLDPDKYLEEHPLAARTTTQGIAIKGTPTIDGTAEALWDNVPEYNINKYVMAWQGATATMKTMWDENNLYVLMDVKDSLLSTAAADAHMQDSVCLLYTSRMMSRRPVRTAPCT